MTWKRQLSSHRVSTVSSTTTTESGAMLWTQSDDKGGLTGKAWNLTQRRSVCLNLIAACYLTPLTETCD